MAPGYGGGCAFGGKGAMMGAYGMPFGGCGPPPGYGGYGPPPGYGGGKGGMAPVEFAGRASGYGAAMPQARIAPAKPQPTGPTVTWINLTEESTLTAEGLPAEAPVLLYEKGVSVFQSTSYIVYDLLGEEKDKLEIVHDPEWTVFPEVGGAMKESGLEETCIAVAKADGRWAVGAGGNWKHRENAAKLALCVALACDSPKLDSILRSHPEFAAMLEKAGLAEVPAPSAAVPARGKKSKAKDFEEAADEPANPIPVVHIITLQEESTLTAEGMPGDGVALVHDKASFAFSEAHNCLSELVGDISAEVVFTHDAEGDKFPEVGSAIKEALDQQWCFCIASCAQHNKWGLGLAGGWKQREVAAKLALAVSICADGGQNLDNCAAQYPEFGQMCANAGFIPSGGFVPIVREEAPAKKKIKGAAFHQGGKEDSELAQMGGLGGDFGGKPSLPKNAPFWLNLPAPPAVLIDGMPSETLMLLGEDGTRKALYAHVDKFLAEFVESVETDIEFVDDPNWENFPEVAAAMEEFTLGDACLHIAVCGSAGVWAAGVGRKWKTRNAASKVALGTVLALRLADSGTGPDMTAFPEFSKFIEEAAALV